MDKTEKALVLSSLSKRLSLYTEGEKMSSITTAPHVSVCAMRPMMCYEQEIEKCTCCDCPRVNMFCVSNKVRLKPELSA